jgi:hypothetical protein
LSFGTNSTNNQSPQVSGTTGLFPFAPGRAFKDGDTFLGGYIRIIAANTPANTNLAVTHGLKAIPRTVEVLDWGTDGTTWLPGNLNLAGGLYPGIAVNFLYWPDATGLATPYSAFFANSSSAVATIYPKVLGVYQQTNAQLLALDASGNLGIAGHYWSNTSGILLAYSGGAANTGFYYDSSNAAAVRCTQFYVQTAAGAAAAPLSCAAITCTSIGANGTVTSGGQGTANAGQIYCTALSSASSVGASYGDIIAQRSASTGFFYSGGATSYAAWYWDGTNANINGSTAGAALIITRSGGYMPVFAASFTPSSDIKFKQNVQNIKRGIDDLLKLTPRSFKWKDNGSQDLGFIAQEVKEIIPEIVVKMKDEDLGLRYNSLIAVIVKAIQQLDARLTAGNL